MPETIAAVGASLDAAFAATAAAVGNTLVAVGVPTATAATIATAIYVAAPTVAMAAASAAAGLALTPPIPKAESVKQNTRQPIPPRLSGYGWGRLGGPYMLREARKKAYFVVAHHDGRCDSFHRNWLNDDEVSVVGNVVQKTAEGSYGANRVLLYSRLGLPSDTSYTTDQDFSELGADVWTADHIGRGIASSFLRLQSVEQEDFRNTYPAGADIAVSRETKMQLVYDWRDEGHEIDDPDTWAWSDNPFLCLAHYLCFAEGGPGYDWDETVAPFLASWTEAANVCDELVPLKAGGSEKRYRANIVHHWDNAPEAVISAFLETCDGRYEEIDGGLKVWAGKYYAPTVTITQAHILSMHIDRFREDEEAVNELRLSYVSRDHAYTPVDITPWRDEADIAARGVTRSESFTVEGCFYNSQMRRLGKARSSRLNAPIRGVMVTDYFGIQAMGERFIRIKFPKRPATADIIVEIDPDAKITFDLTSKTTTIPWILVDPNRYAFDAATEEGDGPSGAPGVIIGDVPTPEIDSVVPFYASTGVGGEGVRLRVFIVDPDDPSFSYALRWRIVGATSWAQSTYTGVAPSGGLIQIETDGFVPANETIEVEVAFLNGSGALSEWSDAVTVDTSLAAAPWSLDSLGSARRADFDASATSTLTLSGSDVSDWASRVRSWSVSGAVRPTYSATGWDGTLPCVTFDGAVSGDILTSASTVPLGDFWAFIVAERGTQQDDAGSSTRPVLATKRATGNISGLATVQRPTSDASQTNFLVLGVGSGSAASSVTGFTNGTKAVLFAGFQDADLRAGVNGGTLGSAGAYGTNTGTSFCIGGDDTNASRRFAGKYAQVLIVDPNALPDGGTVAERQKIEGALAWKWGIQASLASGHPYKTVRP